MKLKELINGMIEHGVFIDPDNKPLNFEFLKLIKERLLECDEFKDVDNLTIIDKPIVTNTEGKIFQTNTVCIGDYMKFKENVYLYQIILSPTIYDPKDINVPVKDGSSITPTMYNPVDFSPHKQIMMTLDPGEFEKDPIDVTRRLHDTLDKILDSPNEYSPKGERKIMVRGLFENWELNGENITSVKVGSINLNDPPKYYMAFFLKRMPVQNFDDSGNPTYIENVNLKLESKLIPAELKDEYLKLFEKRGLDITEKEINDFLESRKK